MSEPHPGSKWGKCSFFMCVPECESAGVGDTGGRDEKLGR